MTHDEPTAGILLLTAMPVEARGLARRLHLARVPRTSWPHYRGGAFELACVGLGAAALPVRSPTWTPPSLVVSAGTCGALAADLAAGDLIVPARVIGGRQVIDTTPLPGLERTGTLVSAPGVVASPAEKWRLGATTGARAVDLESAAILAWAMERRVPAAVIRGVSDSADTPIPAAILSIVTPDGTIPAGALLWRLLRQPELARPLVALARGATAALDAVAGALGRLAAASRAAGTSPSGGQAGASR